ncbi:hypothetical protein [Polaribacter sp.]|uniref:hypothetical protein n=1 Tax=Polaribacter sp. TaxID=1920175 RepID=UPI003F69A6A1
MLYFLVTTKQIEPYQKLLAILIIFGTTYFIPLVLLFLLKSLKKIDSYQLKKRKERKLPLAIMVVLFYALGNLFKRILILEEISLLFHATSLGLIITYFLLNFSIKSSIHLLSIGISCGFFMMVALKSDESYMLIIIINFLIAGLLGSARLHLKAHSPKEVYVGFLIGISTVFGMHIIYSM